MKILVVSINFAPELTGIGKYTGEMAAWLAARGHELRVVTAPPYYPANSIAPGYKATSYRLEAWQGVTVFRTPLWVARRMSGMKRVLHLASFALASLPSIFAQLLWRPQLVWVAQPALFSAPAAVALAGLVGARSWLHVQDFEVDAAFDMGMLEGEKLRRRVEAGERWLLRRFDRVSTISGRMLERAARKGVPAERLVSFPNWVDISSIQPLAQPSDYRAELGIAPATVVALYSGNMAGKQGLEVLAEAAALLAGRSDIAFVFCGDGMGRADLEQRCQSLANVRFLPLQPLERLGKLLGLADIHLLPQRADAADLVMPSKLTGMLASGRPVIATAAPGTELADVVQVRAECGVVVPPADGAAFAAAITELAADAPRRTRLGRNGRAYAERELDREAVLRRFESELLACVDGAGRR